MQNSIKQFVSYLPIVLPLYLVYPIILYLKIQRNCHGRTNETLSVFKECCTSAGLLQFLKLGEGSWWQQVVKYQKKCSCSPLSVSRTHTVHLWGGVFSLQGMLNIPHCHLFIQTQNIPSVGKAVVKGSEHILLILTGSLLARWHPHECTLKHTGIQTES